MRANKSFDVVILGGGLAGIYTALNISRDKSIAIFTKDKLDKGSSNIAQGGIAAEIEFDIEKIKEHYEDTLSAGANLNTPEATRILVSEAPKNIENLLSLGVKLDRDESGKLVKTLEGAHRSKRILHAGGDATGACVMRDLRLEVQNRQNITILEDEMVVELLTQNQRVIGAISVNKENQISYIASNTIVIATGGLGGVYKSSTNEPFALGDGIALAQRAHIDISNMEFIQFHPTGLYEEHKTGQRFLISEAVRGEGAILRNIDYERFMQKYDAKRMELAPRDVVSQAIYREMFDTWSDHVYLDITHKSKEFLMKRFPTIYEKCLSIGIDMSKDYIPVTPLEHFLCGGITCDINGRTSMEGVYAVGECANSGVHGANRLASNSLLECLVFGARIAKCINDGEQKMISFDLPECSILEYRNYNFKRIRNEIQEVMDKYASIVRTVDGLELAYKIINRHYLNLVKMKMSSFSYYEALNMASCSLLIVKSALARRESIGCHYIIDYHMNMNIVDKIIRDALNEDMPKGDITTDNLIPLGHKSHARLIAKEDGILSGCDVVKRVFELVGGNVKIEFKAHDTDILHTGDIIAQIEGETRSILKGERVALNLLQRMCGISTITSKYVSMCHRNCKILDTRKTTPNLRYLEKLAVTHGGGVNHRYGLSDMVMIKDNHIQASGGITPAVERIKPLVDCKIEVEVETIEQFKEALTTACDVIMLDNMNCEMMKECVRLNQGKKQLEASGNMTLQRIEEVSSLGVDFISVGALTHSVKAMDISLKFDK